MNETDRETPPSGLSCCLCLPSVLRRRRRPAPATANAGGAAPSSVFEPPPHAALDPAAIARAPATTTLHVADTCCRKLLRHNGHPSKILLYPEEGWARSASSSYWTLTPFWWSRNRYKVVEVAGTRRYTTHAKLVDNGRGTLYVVGSFKRMTMDSDFKLCLTSNVSIADYNMGYSMTGTLERGCKKSNSYQITHFAVIRRKEDQSTSYQKA